MCGRAIEHYAAMARMKGSRKITANWALPWTTHVAAFPLFLKGRRKPTFSARHYLNVDPPWHADLLVRSDSASVFQTPAIVHARLAVAVGE